MKLPVLFLAVCSALSPVAASTVDLPKYGFSIEALDGTPGADATTPLMLFLPANDGFAPNINVNIQPYPQTIKDYAALSRSQFREMKWTVVNEKLAGEAEWIVEYKGNVEGNDLHFYARAVAKDGKVYLTTGSAKETQWPAVGSILRKHVDSFKLK